MRKRGRLAIILTSIVGLTALGSFIYSENTGTTHLIESSYAFDVTDVQLVAGYADAVFIATVEEVREVQSDRQRTLYDVRVHQILKGTLPDRITVRQLGYSAGGDRYVVEDQPQLGVGQSYLLATTKADSAQYTVIGGPEAAVAVSETSAPSLLARWTSAVANQEYPQGVPR